MQRGKLYVRNLMLDLFNRRRRRGSSDRFFGVIKYQVIKMNLLLLFFQVYRIYYYIILFLNLYKNVVIIFY